MVRKGIKLYYTIELQVLINHTNKTFFTDRFCFGLPRLMYYVVIRETFVYKYQNDVEI